MVLPFTSVPVRITAILLVASILILGLLFSSPSWKSVKHIGSRLQEEPSKKVPVKIYVEALCIDSKNFVLKQLMPTYRELGDSVMDLEMVMYGNAKIDLEAKQVTCQHGFAECDANVYNLCAADIFPYPSRYVPFAECLFENLPMGHRKKPFDSSIFASCAQQSALDWHAIDDCHADTSESWELQKKAAEKTPDYHTYVPWVEVNGSHMEEEKQNLLDVVCEEYEAMGGSHPACASRVQT